jgi:hypothetical protein
MMRYCVCALVFAAYLTAAPVPPPKPIPTFVLEDGKGPTHALTVSPGGKVTARPYSEDRHPRWEGTWKQRGKSLTITTPTRVMKFRLDEGVWAGKGALILTHAQADERARAKTLEALNVQRIAREQRRAAEAEEEKKGR